MIVATLGVQPSLPRPALACIDPINRYSRKEADVKARVHIMLKQGVLDPQGEAVRHALGAMGFQGVEGVRQGKVIELDLAEGTASLKSATCAKSFSPTP